MSDLKKAEEAKTLGIVSLVASILFIIFGTLGSIAGVICGHISLSKFKATGSEDGKGLAIAGLWIGYIGIGLSVLAIIGAVIFFGFLATNPEFMEGVSSGLEEINQEMISE